MTCRLTVALTEQSPNKSRVTDRFHSQSGKALCWGMLRSWSALEQGDVSKCPVSCRRHSTNLPWPSRLAVVSRPTFLQLIAGIKKPSH
eukprot:726181-Prymnesium_polylepis.1